MNDFLIEKWNSVVKPGDIVYTLGDTFFGDREKFKKAMAKIGLDKKQPERVRAVAIAAVSSALNGGPVRGRPAELEEVVAQAARERGREQGVPASVWQEARKNFLGPAPEEAEQGGEVVEFEQATTPG
jgi:hypothetical protein